MKKNSIELGSKVKPASKTDWNKLINQKIAKFCEMQTQIQKALY